MNQLDQVTQTNSTGSQDLASTSEELDGQISSLVEVMEFFKFSDKHSSKHSATERNNYALPSKTDAHDDLDVREFSRY